MSEPIKMLFTVPYGTENMQKIGALGYDITFIKESELNAETVPQDIEVLVCYNPFELIDLSIFRNLKWIQLVSKGIDQAPERLVKERNIAVTNNGDATSVPVSEWIVAMIMFLYKNSAAVHEKKNNRHWSLDKDVLEVSGAVIGFLGTGNIAKKAAERLVPFDVKLLGINTSGRVVDPFLECYTLDDLDNFLPKCDVVISTLPDSPDTRHLLCAKTFAIMKKDVSLINISRGSVVDENALIKFLGKGHFRGVALDVFSEEPLPDTSPLWDFDNVIITPHNSFLSTSYRDRVFSVIYNNLKNYREGRPLENIVDFDKGY